MEKRIQALWKPAQKAVPCGPCYTYKPARGQPFLVAAWYNMLCATTRLKDVSKALLLAQCLDIITTMGGLYLLPQVWETNPLPYLLGGWSQTILFKLAVAMTVVGVLEAVEKWPVIVKIIPITAILPGIWNLFLIVFEYFA